MLNNSKRPEADSSEEYIFCPYITKNGKRYYPKNVKFFKFLKPKK